MEIHRKRRIQLMKLVFRLLACVAVCLLILVAVVKIVQKCTWREAFGTIHEMFKELSCPLCCKEEEPAETTEEA
jgi:hypothetical protein